MVMHLTKSLGEVVVCVSHPKNVNDYATKLDNAMFSPTMLLRNIVGTLGQMALKEYHRQEWFQEQKVVAFKMAQTMSKLDMV